MSKGKSQFITKKYLLLLALIITACSNTIPTSTQVDVATVVSSTFEASKTPILISTPTETSITLTSTVIPATETPLPPTNTPTPRPTDALTPTATEVSNLPVVLEGEQRQEIIDNIPHANLWLPDGDHMRLLNAENIEFRQSAGDKFIRGYENGKLVLLTEPSSARSEWMTFGVSGVHQGRVFKSVIVAYQLNVPDECPVIGSGGSCLSFSNKINRLNLEQRPVGYDYFQGVESYIEAGNELTQWEIDATTSAEILEAALIRGIAISAGIDFAELVDKLQTNQIVEIVLPNGETVQLSNMNDLTAIHQEPGTFTRSGGAPGVAFTIEGNGLGITFRSGRMLYSSETYLDDQFASDILILPILDNLTNQEVNLLTALIFGFTEDDRNAPLFIMQDYDPITGAANP